MVLVYKKFIFSVNMKKKHLFVSYYKYVKVVHKHTVPGPMFFVLIALNWILNYDVMVDTCYFLHIFYHLCTAIKNINCNYKKTVLDN
jgi:hypothetical protein